MLSMSYLFGSDLTKVDLKKLKPIKIEALELDSKRTMVLKGVVEEGLISGLIQQFQKMVKEDKKDVFLVIDTPGGSITDGIKFINMMKSAKLKHKVNTICVIENEAYSMGAVISAYCHKTYMHRFGSLMWHEAAYGVQGMAYHIPKRLKFTEKYLELFDKDIAKQLGMTHKEYLEFQNLEHWLTSEEAVEQGFADAIVESFYYDAEPPAVNPFAGLFGGRQALVRNPLTPVKQN